MSEVHLPQIASNDDSVLRERQAPRNDKKDVLSFGVLK